MREIKINLENRLSTVYAGGSIDDIGRYADLSKSIIVTDVNVHRLYADRFNGIPAIVIGAGEGIKTLATVEQIMRELIALGADRNTFIIGIGGGIVSDIAGFTASIFMRGLDFGFVSTTLLSQVDASVGGKNGVNIDRLKNMAGVFCQPRFVICDQAMLATLTEEEYRNGLAELIKTACLDKTGLYDFVCQHREALRSRESAAVEEAVYRCAAFKASVVAQDEKETGLRRILNLGHTAGHAVEKVHGVAHGHAVAAGIGFSLFMSKKLGLIDSSTAGQVLSMLKFFGLPSGIYDTASAEDSVKLAEAAASDKKRDGSTIKFVLLEGIGKPAVQDINLSDLEKLIYEHITCGENCL
ncbi:MAG TPA: 3-dehydroquinate synthase [Spirochaetota bacterium]|nr:3-dehydroquinate synthase [Spirochaetota bacterium]